MKATEHHPEASVSGGAFSSASTRQRVTDERQFVIHRHDRQRFRLEAGIFYGHLCPINICGEWYQPHGALRLLAYRGLPLFNTADSPAEVLWAEVPLFAEAGLNSEAHPQQEVSACLRIKKVEGVY